MESATIIIGKLLNIGGMLQKTGNQLLLPFNLNQHQYSILFDIYKKERVMQKSMVNRLLLEKAHVSKIVKKLHAMGLVEIEASEEDKRAYWISITEKGKQTVKECKERIQTWNEDWTDELDEDQMKEILDSLAVMQQVFRKKL
jgi:DNA-binding MarR family transcriptional regulator